MKNDLVTRLQESDGYAVEITENRRQYGVADVQLLREAAREIQALQEEVYNLRRTLSQVSNLTDQVTTVIRGQLALDLVDL